MLTSYNASEVEGNSIGLNGGGLVDSQFPTVLKINPKSSVLMQGPQSAVLAVKKSFLKTNARTPECCTSG